MVQAAVNDRIFNGAARVYMYLALNSYLWQQQKLQTRNYLT